MTNETRTKDGELFANCTRLFLPAFFKSREFLTKDLALINGDVMRKDGRELVEWMQSARLDDFFASKFYCDMEIKGQLQDRILAWEQDIVKANDAIRRITEEHSPYLATSSTKPVEKVGNIRI